MGERSYNYRSSNDDKRYWGFHIGDAYMKNRRGLSSVVGAVFAIIAMATTVGYITYSMNVLDNYNQAVLARNQQTTDIANEKFQLSGATFPSNNKLNITVANTGNLPINFTKIWITDSSTSPAWVKSYVPTNAIVSPGATLTNIGQSIPGSLSTTDSYNIKLVTSRGNNLQFPISSVGQQPLDVKVDTLPATVSSYFDTVVLMSVTNNATNAATITNLQPMISIPDTSACLLSPCYANLVSGPSPLSYPALKPGQTATFRWIYQLIGPEASTIKFTVGLKNGTNPISVSNATTNVVVKDIVSSLTAGSALTTKGVSTSSTSNNTLYMHTETNLIPSGSNHYQLMPPYADVAGSTISGFPKMQFFTENTTAATITMNAGSMNASLRYTNDRLANGVSDNSDSGQTLHFNRTYCGSANCDRSIDSSKSGNDCWDLANSASGKPSGTSSQPTQSTTYGVNGSSGANFNGLKWYNLAPSNSCNSPRTNQFSLTTWFKADVKVGYDTKQIIWRLGSTGTEFYEIAIGDGTSGNHGRVYFTVNGGGASTSCSSTTTAYMDGNWHHLAAVRTGDYSCKLYIDGTLQSGPGTTGNGDNSIDYTTSAVSIGRLPSTSSSACSGSCTNGYFGSLDDMLFWNNHQLSSTEVTSVKNTNYGTAAFKVGMVLDQTNSNGAKLANIISLTTKSMPYSDKEHWSSNTGNTPDRQYYWAGGNYSISLPQIILSPTQRLNFTFYESSGLNADVRLDDKSFTGTSPDPYSSFIQYSGSNSIFPTYLQYNRCAALIILLYNQGPYSSWLVYQGTRATFDNISGSDSYAGIIHYVSNSLMDSNNDSPLIKVGDTSTLEFYPIQSKPDKNQQGGFCGAGTISTGTYMMNVFISGYDETGQTFLRNVPMGQVLVY
jgi:hypothetical protein